MREFSLMETFAIVAAGLLAIVAAGLVIWLVPRWQVHRWRRAGISSEEKLAELGLQARTSITQALGGLALIVTIAITANQALEANRSAAKNLEVAGDNLDVTERGQVSERFANAIDQLGATREGGDKAVDVRTGALFSLMRVGLDSEDHEEPVFRVVAAYVVNNHEKPRKRAPRCRATYEVKEDVSVALRFVLPAVAKDWLASKDAPERAAGLRGSDLDRLALDNLEFRSFNLTNITFRDASLKGADFHDSNLTGANFTRACLRGADFGKANLRKARFVGASLEGANFKGVKLRDATFKGARFTKADLDRAPLSEAQKHDARVVPP